MLSEGILGFPNTDTVMWYTIRILSESTSFHSPNTYLATALPQTIEYICAVAFFFFCIPTKLFTLAQNNIKLLFKICSVEYLALFLITLKYLFSSILASTTKSANEILKEADTDIQVCPNYSIPQKTDSYFNPKMKLNR